MIDYIRARFYAGYQGLVLKANDPWAGLIKYGTGHEPKQLGKYVAFNPNKKRGD